MRWEANTISAEPKAVQETAAKRAVTVTLSLADSRTYVLLVGDRTEDGQYPCVLQNGAYCYYVPEWRISQALAARESLSQSR